MKGPRILVVAALVIMAAVAGAQEGTEYVPQEESRCWECHSPGLWNPPMNPNVEVFPLLADVAIGDEFDYQAELLNAWRAEQLDMTTTLDITQAPSLRFVGGTEPWNNETTGAITFEPSAPAPLQPLDNFLTQPATGRVPIYVPSGATDLQITLLPDDTSTQTGPDLTLNIYDARTDPSGDPSLSIDKNGRGMQEQFHVQGAAPVASRGAGEWIIEAAVTRVATTGTPEVDPQASDVGFTVVMDAFFNATEETQQVVVKPGPLAKGSREIFSWRVQLVQEPAEGEQIVVRANVTTHYIHEPGTEDADFANMTFEKVGPIVLADGNVNIGLAPAEVIVNGVQPTGVSMAAISEAVGYAAAFLLAASIYTGGMFGKASRRGLNVIFGGARRRVAFHNFLSYGIITAASIHMTIFVIDAIEPNYPWQLGLIWGGLSILSMLLLGVTGAMQVPMIRKWNYATWRWIHFGLSISAILFMLVHMGLDGQNFGFIQEALDYQDPLVPATQA